MQHLRGVRQFFGSGGDNLTSVGKICSGVSIDVPLGKLQHKTVNFLRLAWESECLQERSQRIYKLGVLEVQEIDKRVHDCNVVLIAGTNVRKQ
jgi:hypothetical protein